jgi:hypothetical protein
VGFGLEHDGRIRPSSATTAAELRAQHLLGSTVQVLRPAASAAQCGSVRLTFTVEGLRRAGDQGVDLKRLKALLAVGLETMTRPESGQGAV